MNNGNLQRIITDKHFLEYSGMGVQPISIPSNQQSDPSIASLDGSNASSRSLSDGVNIDPSVKSDNAKMSLSLFDDPKGMISIHKECLILYHSLLLTYF